MNLCTKDHEEICYEGYTCPLCDYKKEVDSKLEEATNKIDQLNDEIYELETKLEATATENN